MSSSCGGSTDGLFATATGNTATTVRLISGSALGRISCPIARSAPRCPSTGGPGPSTTRLSPRVPAWSVQPSYLGAAPGTAAYRGAVAISSSAGAGSVTFGSDLRATFCPNGSRLCSGITTGPPPTRCLTGSGGPTPWSSGNGQASGTVTGGKGQRRATYSPIPTAGSDRPARKDVGPTDGTPEGVASSAFSDPTISLEAFYPAAVATAHPRGSTVTGTPIGTQLHGSGSPAPTGEAAATVARIAYTA